MTQDQPQPPPLLIAAVAMLQRGNMVAALKLVRGDRSLGL